MAGISAITAGVSGSDSYQNPNAKELLVSWTGDSIDGSVPDLLIDDFPLWWITRIITKPGSPAPTALHDITGIGPDGDDLLEDALLNRSASAVDPQETMAVQIPLGGIILKWANQSVAGAKGTARITINK
jgi:hypothetical protein